MSKMMSELARRLKARSDVLAIFFLFSTLYIFLSWVVCGGDRWWIIDYVDNSNIFYGDDAYRFFLARSAWLNPDLYTYNFALPGFLFLDGLVTTLAGGDLLLSRSVHAMLGAVTLCLVWDMGKQIGIGRYIMVAAILMLGLLPRYALMSLSFYGEVWLGFLLCLLSWLFLRQKWMAVAIVASLMPLVRPEGFFFLLPFLAVMLKERRWTHAALMLAPGFLYFLFLCVQLDSLRDYNYWRYELRRILSRLVINRGKWDIVSSYSPLLTLPPLLGWLYAPVRRLWPALLAALLFLVWMQFDIYRGALTYEDRYTYSMLPLLLILWASFWAWLWSALPAWVVARPLQIAIVLIVACLVIVRHFGQMQQVQRGIHAYGLSRTLSYMAQGDWHKLFNFYTPLQTKSWRVMAGKIESLLAKDEAIDKVVMFDSGLYYMLDPRAVPKNVTIGYPASGYMVFHVLLNGQVFTQHPGGRMYSYLQYGKPDFHKGERRVLYVDLMPLENYPFAWTVSQYELYLFAYHQSFEPQTDLSKSPMLTPAMVDQLYRPWVHLQK